MKIIIDLSQRTFAFLYWLLSKFWYRLEIRGLENIQNLQGPLIIIANHKSRADHFFIGAGFPGIWTTPLLPINIMAKDSLFANPIGNLFFRMIGTYPAKFKQGIDVSLAEPLGLLSEARVVGIYPEGRRNFSDNVSDFKRGVGELIKRTPNTPVLPVAVIGSNRMIGQLIPYFGGTIKVCYDQAYKFDASEPVEKIISDLREKFVELYTAGQK